MAKLISGKATTMREIAKEYKMDRSFAARTLQLANLAPDIVKMIWENCQPASLTLDKLRRGIPPTVGKNSANFSSGNSRPDALRIGHNG